MFPPKQPQPAGQPQQPPQQPAPPQQGQPNTTPQGGPQQVANIGFNQDVQNILLSRIQKMPPQAQKILDSVLTPQTIPVFLMLLPELKPLFDHMMQAAQQGPIGQPGQPPASQGAPPSPSGAPAGGPPAPGGAPSAAQPGGQPGQEPEGDEEESDNPLVKAPASNGLIG